MLAYSLKYGCSQKPEDIRHPGFGITGGSELENTGDQTLLRSSTRVAIILTH